MADRTKFQDVRAALKTAITAQLTDDGVDAEYSNHPPLGDHVGEDRVYLGEVRFAQEPYTGGFYEESIEVDLFVDAWVSGGTNDEADEAEAAAETIFDSILETLRTDITIGSTVFNVELGGSESKVIPVDQWVVGRVEATLEIEAHIGA